MAAVAVAIVGSILFAMSAGGGADIGQAVADTIHGMIASLGEGGGSGSISEDLSPPENPVPRPMLDRSFVPCIGLVDFVGGFAGGGGGGGSGGAVDVDLYVKGKDDEFDIQYNDVQQGNLDDCYVMAALAAVAKDNPDIIRNMIRENGDGTYTVTFHTHHWLWGWGTKEVTISANDLPKYGGSTDSDKGLEELWPAIIEKAYAEWQAGGNYGEIEGGRARDVLAALTGVEGKNYYVPLLTPALGRKIHDALQEGNPVTASFYSTDHVCAITGIDGNQVKLYNPATGKEEVVSLSELRTDAANVSISPIH